VIRKTFLGDSDTGYMPHLSLLYGEFPIEVKEKIAKKSETTLLDEFEVHTLYLYLTEGLAIDWQGIGVFSLQNVGS
jgi:hypothetical protein